MTFIDGIALLALALITAKLLGGIGEKFGIPAVLVELCTGVALGNLGGGLGTAFANLESSEMLHALSELGILLLLFSVGQETDLREIKKVGTDAALTAIIGVVAPFALAFAALPFLFEASFNHHLFMAAVLTATSVGITARVLRDCGKLTSLSGRIILGAAVIDDILGILILAIVTGITTSGDFSAVSVGILICKVLLFLLGAIAVKSFAIKPLLRFFCRFEVSGTATVLLLSLCYLSAWIAEKSGLAGIIGAFALGIAVDNTHFSGYRATEKLAVEDLIRPITDFLVPIFFIAMGMRVQISRIGESEVLKLGGILILCGVVGKLICGLGVRPQTRQKGADRFLVGIGMIPRGEVGLIFAATGLQYHILSQSDYAGVLTMVAVTTLVAPVLIAWRVKQT